jgi:glycosyltransferase involved in cell wall biosynthesis
MGMHRSGTSAVGKFVHDLGFEMPAPPLSAHPIDNPEGYWEAKAVVQINNKFFKCIGSSWKCTNPISAEVFRHPAAADAHSQIRDLLRGAFSSHDQILLKDPRFCRLLPLWKPVLEDMDIPTVVIFIVRPADEVAASLARRRELSDIAVAAVEPKETASLLWLRYNLDAWRHSQEFNSTKLSYRAWLRDSSARSELVGFIARALPHARLRKANPTIREPSHVAAGQPTTRCTPAWRVLTRRTYAELTRREAQDPSWLEQLAESANITVPDTHQTLSEALPGDLKDRAQWKHISGRVSGTAETYARRLPRFLMPRRDRPIVYVGENARTRGHIYRIKNPVDALVASGVPALWCSLADLDRYAATLTCARCVICHRCEWTAELERAYRLCRRHRVPVGFDIDDLIFNPETIAAGDIHFIKNLDEAAREQWMERAGAYRKALQEADFALAPTPRLAAEIESINPRCILKPNGFSTENLMLSEFWRAHRPVGDDGRPRIGYASGTPTHDRDFATIADALSGFLHENPNWMFTIVGELDLTACGKMFREQQIERRPLVEHVNLAYELARFDVNLIPLELDNRFCTAKSPLKWFEAALCGVPSIVSKNETYAALIVEGETGLLSRDSAQWSQHLQKLANDPAVRRRIGDASADFCKAHFAESVLVKTLMKEIKAL